MAKGPRSSNASASSSKPSPSSKPSSKPSPKASKKASAPLPPPPAADDSDEESGSDEEITEADMKRLMDALGKDGLEEAVAMMGGEGGSDDDENEDDDEEEDDEDFESGEGEDLSEEDDALLVDEDEEDEVVRGLNLEEEEDEEDESRMLALDDMGSEDGSVDEDAIPKQKVTIYNKPAMLSLLSTLQAPYAQMPWEELMNVTAPDAIQGSVDAEDDLAREVAFYKQALSSAITARALCAQNGVAFTRPSDYYAEMVKSDAHMERIRQKLLDETSGIKKSEDARRQRDLKKFGKKVQVAKLQEREGEKRALGDKLKGLKRKRKDGEATANGGDDDFDVKLEDALSNSRPEKSARGSAGGRGRGSDRGSKITRRGRDSKFGFGQGADRRSKSNTRESTEDDGAFGGGRGRGGGRGGRGGRGGGRGGGGRGGGGGGDRGAKRAGRGKRMAGGK